MKRICFIVLFLVSFGSICFAVDPFCIEDESLKLVPSFVSKAIMASEKDDELKSCKFIGQLIDLDGDGKAEDYAVTTDAPCGCGNALCTIWLLRHTGNTYVIVLTDGGYLMNIKKQKHNGLFDISFETGTAGWSRKTTWIFNGKRYIKTKEINR